MSDVKTARSYRGSVKTWWKLMAQLGVYLISIAWKKSGKGQNWRVEFHSMKKN